jgi:hypothetical protein
VYCHAPDSSTAAAVYVKGPCKCIKQQKIGLRHWAISSSSTSLLVLPVPLRLVAGEDSSGALQECSEAEGQRKMQRHVGWETPEVDDECQSAHKPASSSVSMAAPATPSACVIPLPSLARVHYLHAPYWVYSLILLYYCQIYYLMMSQMFIWASRPMLWWLTSLDKPLDRLPIRYVFIEIITELEIYRIYEVVLLII